MDKNLKPLLGLLGVCLFWFCIFSWLGVNYFGHYGIPWGMSDVDRYVAWYNQGYIDGSLEAVFHAFTIQELMLLTGGHFLYGVNLVIPALIWILIPVSLFILYRNWRSNPRNSLLQVLFFMFGSFALMFFQFTALWAELLSFICFIWALIAWANRPDGLPWMFIFFVCSIAFHPLILGVWYLFLLAYLWDRNNKALAVYFGFVAIPLIFGFGLSRILIPWSTYPINEPGLYIMLFVYTCPLLVIFGLVGWPIRRLELQSFALLLFLICPFIQLGRGMPFAQIFLAPYALTGFKRVRSKFPRWFWIVCLFLVYLWLDNFYGFIAGNMDRELILRGLDPAFYRALMKGQV